MPSRRRMPSEHLSGEDHMVDAPPLIRLLAVGDVCIDRDDPPFAFVPSLALLGAGDILFGNCEAVYAHHAERAPSASIPVLCTPKHATGLGHAGFDVMSLANNHAVDGGHTAMFETIDHLRDQGIAVCGAGADRAEAVAPAILERNGLRIAFLAYSCVYPAGYDARDGIPGIATIRTHTVYVPSALDAFQSGGPPDRFSFANPDDVRAFTAQIERVVPTVDCVVVSVHAGDGSRPAVVTDYERQLARAAIDAGADVYLGHHHHMLRGADIYRGKPIFYGLGHFVFDIPDLNSQVPPSIMSQLSGYAGEYAYGARKGYPLLPMHPEARMTAVAVIDLDKGGVRAAGVVPALLNPDGQPIPQDLSAPGGANVADYLDSLNTRAGLRASWTRGTRDLVGFGVLEVTPPDTAELGESAGDRRRGSEGFRSL